MVRLASVVCANCRTCVSRARALELLPHLREDFARMRNYEIQGELEDLFGATWVISEWCPFNGIHTAWCHVAPRAVREKTANWWRVNRASLTADHYNVDAHIRYLLWDDEALGIRESA